MLGSRHAVRGQAGLVTVLFALALVGAMLTPLGLGVLERADAATVPLGAIQANVSNHHGTDGGTDTTNCVRYSPTGARRQLGLRRRRQRGADVPRLQRQLSGPAVDQHAERDRRVTGQHVLGAGRRPVPPRPGDALQQPGHGRGRPLLGSVHDPGGRLRHHARPHLRVDHVGDPQQREPVRVHRDRGSQRQRVCRPDHLQRPGATTRR